MKQFFLICSAIFVLFSHNAFAQIPTATLVQIVRSEDERRFDQTLENLLANPNEKIRTRAALAAGRIGDERAVPTLVKILQNDSVTEVRAMAAFALGEIESIRAAEALLNVLQNTRISSDIRARAVEAAGKIVAVNPKEEKAKPLGEAILSALAFEHEKRSGPYQNIIKAALTAVLRARPAEAEKTVVNFITAYTPEIRADALNTLARLRAKNANENARELLQKDTDPIVRANAARVLGAAEDKDALDLLFKAATTDADSRVRVSAIRSLASLNEVSIAEELIPSSETIMTYIAFPQICEATKKQFDSSTCFINEKGKLLEIATTLGRLLSNTNNPKAIYFLVTLNEIDKYQSPEIETALARIAPTKFSEFQRNKKDNLKSDWRAINATMAGIGELANAPDSAEIAPIKEQAKKTALEYIRKQFSANLAEDKTLSGALSAYAAYKTTDLPQILREALQHRDAVVRASAAGMLGETASSPETIESLKKAFAKSLSTDKHDNDAQLAILSALVKLDKPQSFESLRLALKAPDFLVRRHAANLIRNNDLTKDFSNIEKMVGAVSLYNAATGTKLGQVLNSNADYTRAVSRKNARAIITTAKGAFTIEFFPEAAPLTVDNFIKLARSGYFNNLMIHRVVPNFVMQDGDPRGDGTGGPGWSIRCEINQIEYGRGMVGMALSGKDTGGSQWFVTHSPQPHLDGGYTVFGRVNETDMEIVDNLARGDKILSVKIVEGGSPQRRR
jgi:cyclophilin family peptidyl-prolyl cis-trans isomerase/HEAT repeat protein